MERCRVRVHVGNGQDKSVQVSFLINWSTVFPPIQLKVFSRLQSQKMERCRYVGNGQEKSVPFLSSSHSKRGRGGGAVGFHPCNWFANSCFMSLSRQNQWTDLSAMCSAYYILEAISHKALYGCKYLIQGDPKRLWIVIFLWRNQKNQKLHKLNDFWKPIYWEVLVFWCLTCLRCKLFFRFRVLTK